MAEVGRRDFIKLGLLATASIAASDFPKELHQNNEGLKRTVNFRFIGPEIGSVSKSGESDGERAIWADPENSDDMLAGTWNTGFFSTNNGGASWRREIPPVNDPKEIVRDIIGANSRAQIVISDYSAALRRVNKSEVKWININLPHPSGASNFQTGEFVKDRILIGGFGFFPIHFAQISDLGGSEEIWKKSTGINGAMIRTIKYDEHSGTVYAGGWTSETNKPMKPGTGLLESHDGGVTFTHSPLFEIIKDARGPMPINSIEVSYFQGHQIIFIGGEGSGVENGRKYSDAFPALFIIVDGKLLPQNQLNLSALAASGGSDIISPQRGFVVTDRLWVSTYSQGISSVSLSEIIGGKILNWERNALPPRGQKDFGAVHMRLTKNIFGSPQLVVGRKIYGNNVHFQQAAIGNI